MKDMLQLYYGRLSPYWTKPSNPELDRARESASHEDAYLAARLSKKKRRHLLRFFDACNAAGNIASEQEFRRGFSLGAQLMIAVFREEDACPREQPQPRRPGQRRGPSPPGRPPPL